RLAEKAGYALARTTLAYRTELSFNPFAMPVSDHLRRHARHIHARHGLLIGDLSGLFTWLLRYRAAVDPLVLARRMVARVRSHGGIYHCWGNSWEIDQLGMWDLLRELLGILAGQAGVRYATNSQIVGLP